MTKTKVSAFINVPGPLLTFEFIQGFLHVSNESWRISMYMKSQWFNNKRLVTVFQEHK
ncbi:hypothetical protein Hanom_Chr03g00226941 [Helianthus anomalus]